MSRTDLLAAGDPARPATRFHDDDAAQAASPVIAAIPQAALALLPALHREGGRDLELLGLLAASPRFCLALMAQAAVVLAWSGMEGDISLGARFVWAAALLLGIAAITRNHIQGFARSPRPAPLAAAAGELRALVLYTGLAWGLGAFLVWPATALSAFIFIAAPVLAAALILRCERTVIAFAAPASALAAIAIGWRGQPLLAVALAAVSIAGVSMLHCAIHRRLLQR
jgi:hypothetical protein